MAKIHVIQPDFTAGQISPRLLSRVDLDTYGRGAKQMKNAYALPHGGATRRPGTYWIDEVYNSDEEVRLIPFVFSRAAAYVLILNDMRMEFLKDGVFIEDGPNYYGIAMPYTEEELPEVRYAQIGATMFFAHPNHHPKVLTRYNDTNWTLLDVDFDYRAVTDYWFTTGYVRFKVIPGTVDFAIGDVITIDTGFGQTPGGSNVGNGIIYGIEFYDTPEVWTVTCIFADADRQEWSVVGSVSGESTCTWTTGNYPAAVSLYEQRLYWAGTPNEPQTLFGSASGNYQDMTLGARANDGIQFTIASNTFDQILHLVSARQLLPFSYGGEFSVIGGESVGITPSTVRIFSQTSHGTSVVTPIRIGQEVLFTQRGNKKLRAVSYSIREDVNVAPDITILSENITESGIRDASFAQDPDYIAWFTRDDGKLLSLTHLRDFDVTAWAIHESTNGAFENLATIPEGETDVTYVVVKREINGVTRRYIEFFEYADEVHSDSSLIGHDPGNPKTTWAGLDHLEGEEVVVVADGNVHPNRTVTGGVIELDYEAEYIIVGLGYETLIETLHPHMSLPDGSSQGRNLSVDHVTLKLQDTVGCWVNNVEQWFKVFGDEFDSPIPLRTGDLAVETAGWSSDRGTVIVEQKIPKPFTLLGMTVRVSVND